jgi:hypothetical protein
VDYTGEATGGYAMMTQQWRYHGKAWRRGRTVTDLPVPAAARLQRPRWRDARLVVGLFLVLASAALGSAVVGHADDRSPVYAARTALVPGQRLTEADLTRVEVQLGDLAGGYVAAGRLLAPDRFVLREVRAGELVPVTSVGGRGDVALQPVTIPVDSGSAAGLAVGSRVDVYVNRPAASPAAGSAEPRPVAGDRDSGYAGPQLALHAVSVAGMPSEGGGLGAASSDRPVQVMVPTAAIRGLIGSLDDGARVTLVPVPGSALERAQ